MTVFRAGGVARAAGALLAAYCGGLFAYGSALATWWSGPAAGFVALALLCLAGAAAAWWFLLPRARWWGLPVTVVVALLHAAAFSSGI